MDAQKKAAIVVPPGRAGERQPWAEREMGLDGRWRALSTNVEEAAASTVE